MGKGVGEVFGGKIMISFRIMGEKGKIVNIIIVL